MNLKSLVLAFCGAILCLGCTSDEGLAPIAEEMGAVEISFGAATRATTTTISAEEAKNFLVTIHRGGQVFRGPQTLGEMDMRIPVGQGYSIAAENCTTADAEAANEGWGQKHFVGSSAEFGVSRGQTTKVKVGLKVWNASFCVRINTPLVGEFADAWTLNIHEGNRDLTWSSHNAGNPDTDGQTAFFNVDEAGVRTLAYTYTLVVQGSPIVSEGTVQLARAKSTRVNLSLDASTFALQVNVDDEDLYVDSEVVVSQDDLTVDNGRTSGTPSHEGFDAEDGEADYNQYD